MIDKELFHSVSDNISDLERKEYEVSSLTDFLTQTSGTCTVVVNERYILRVPASLLTDYFSAKKTDLEAEIAVIETSVRAELPDLEAKVKDK